jgi:hypothetical protein
MIENKKCEWCENGLCILFRSEEQQYDDEQDGLPTDWCDGSEEYMRECGMLNEN